MASDPVMVPTSADVDAFLDAVPDEGRRADARALVTLMRSVTNQPPVLWGPSIVGFGSHRYRYPTGRTGQEPIAAFSPRKAALVVYLEAGFEDRYPELVGQLGPHRSGSACLYLKRLREVDVDVLRQLIVRSMPAGEDDDGSTSGEQP